MSEFDQHAFNINCVDFYNTVYVASDLASDCSHPDSDTDFYSSNPIHKGMISNKPLTPQYESISDRIYTPLRLLRPLAMNISDVYLSDDVYDV